MNPRTTKKNTLIGMLREGRLDVIGAALVLLIGLATLPLQLILTQVYIQTLPLVLTASSLLYLIAVRHEQERAITTISPNVAKALPAITILCMALLVVLGIVQGDRTLLFYDVAAATTMLLLAQILFTGEREFSPVLLLLQIILLGLVIRFAALFTTPGYIGIDVWSHTPTWSAQILEAGSLEPISNDKYYASPLYHLLVVGASLLLDLPIREALYLTLGVAMPLSVLFVYATARYFVGVRWAVFATAVFTVSSHVIEWGIHLIPTSLGLIFFLAILYTLTRVLHLDYRFRDFALVVLFSVATILTHQVSAFIMLAFTGAGLLAQFVLSIGLFNPRMSNPLKFDSQDTVNLSGLLAFDLGLITFMWSLTPYQGDTFLMTIFSYLQTTIVESGGLGSGVGQEAPSGGIGAQPTFMDQFVEYLDVTGFLLLLLLTIVGSVYILRRENASHATFTGVVATVVMLVFVFGFPMFGIETFVPGRWFAFLTAPMAIIGALGLAFLVQRIGPRGAAVILLVFIVAFPTVSMLASNGTIDSPPFEGTQTRYSYTDAELTAAQTIGETTRLGEDETIHSDHPYQTIFDRWQMTPTDAAVVDNGTTTNETFIYRDYQSSGAAYFNHPEGPAYTPPVDRERMCGGPRDVTYDNGEVTTCTVTG
ncbi:hypothetical protein [Halegenticoccus tardaugens]|uniref:hypothetical protein n=1 Tax=Halegenticoccus tardaugens TaxID=2071624 RepID=UPI00100B785C|nr:hypothetical protein [Halegenticoccus tardaugens]